MKRRFWVALNAIFVMFFFFSIKHPLESFCFV